MASAKVLLVDDDVELLELLASYLERDGFESPQRAMPNPASQPRCRAATSWSSSM
jgi:CheY-like chemotaxis protein